MIQSSLWHGRDFLVAMRKYRKFDDIPVLMLSSVDSAVLARTMKNLGAASFMTKPPRSSALFDTINTVVHKGHFKALENKSSAQGVEPPLNTAKPPEEAATINVANDIEILIAEDNDVNQRFMRHAMTGLGYTYKIVENGKLAIEKWQLLNPKVILMDISMPELNGYEAT